MSKNNETSQTTAQCAIQNVNHSLSQLKEGDYIAFPFTWNGERVELMVSNITSVHCDKYLTHFLYGHHSLAEYIHKDDIIAIGDMKAEGKVKGWSGKFNILKPEHELLKDCG